MTERIRLESPEAVVEVLPKLGGAIGAFDLKAGAEKMPVFRRWTGESDNPRALASSPMVPWFNRISGGGFMFDGAWYAVSPNDPLEPVPLHGDGWHSPWEVTERAGNIVRMRLRSRAIPPFDYEAKQAVTLAGTTLDMTLAVKHLGDKPIPYGLGLHPWFPRTPGTRLHARATGVWLIQPPDFPDSPTADAIPAEWDFNTSRRLPGEFFDNGFAGWDGRARIEWQDKGIALDVEADKETRFYHVYSLGEDCPHFCFEPVTHPNNALGKPGTPEENGLRVLQPGEETSMHVRFTAQRM